MDRQHYISSRGNSSIDPLVIHEYYKEHGGKLNIRQFINHFNIYISVNNFNSSPIFDYFDKKFNVTLVFDKNNQFIKAV